MKMNRTERRRLRRYAEATARVMAGEVYDYDASRRLTKISSARALALLERAFTHMLKNGGEPYTTVISLEDMACFPRNGSEAHGGYVAALSVGLDADGRGTYSIQSTYTPGVGLDEQRERAKAAARASLRLHTAYSGFTQ